MTGVVIPFRRHEEPNNMVEGLRDLADRIERGEVQGEGIAVFVAQSAGGSCEAMRFGTVYPLTLLGAIQYIALRWVEESQ